MNDQPTDVPSILPLPPRIYGVWLPRVGWLRDQDKNLFGSEDILLAEQTARWFGGRVLITDPEYTAFEAQMLLAESEKRYGLFGKRR